MRKLAGLVAAALTALAPLAAAALEPCIPCHLEKTPAAVAQ